MYFSRDMGLLNTATFFGGVIGSTAWMNNTREVSKRHYGGNDDS